MGKFKGGFLMFANFDKVFNKKKNAKVKIPDSLLAYLNKGLPEGFKYVVSKSGLCCLTPESSEITISGYNFALDEKQPSPTFKYVDAFLILNWD